MLNTKRIKFIQHIVETLPDFFSLRLPNDGNIFSATLFFAFALSIADNSFNDGRISSSSEVFMISHTSTMLLLFLLLPFLPTYCFSVTKAMLENDRPGSDEVNHFKNLDNTSKDSATPRTCSQIFDLVLIQALSHFRSFLSRVSQRKPY